MTWRVNMHNSSPVNWPLLAGVRFFLAWVVMTAHIDFYAPGGIAAAFYMFGAKASVAAFLLISGFSIAASIESRPHGFILRRLLRIYPLYFGALLLTLFVQSFIVSNADNPIYPADGWGKVIGNMLMTQMFFVKALVYNGPFWSLSIEFFFYVLALNSVICLTTALSIIVFDAYLKNTLFRPLFTKLLNSSIWRKTVFSHVPQKIAVSYRL